jgi:hypothetical protein
LGKIDIVITRYNLIPYDEKPPQCFGKKDQRGEMGIDVPPKVDLMHTATPCFPIGEFVGRCLGNVCRKKHVE